MYSVMMIRQSLLPELLELDTLLEPNNRRENSTLLDR